MFYADQSINGVPYFDSEFANDLIPSAWTDYPSKIKFHSIDMTWAKPSNILTRKTFTIFDLFKDVGGFGSFLFTSLSIMIPFFGNVKILGLLAASAYS